MRVADRVLGYATLTVCTGKTLDKCAVFLIFRRRACEKRRRRFALPAQSKEVLWSAVGSGAPHRFSLGTIPGNQF